jgi:protein phosphatase
MKYAALTDKGRKRKINEDSFLANGKLFAVADGLGGYASGEIASKKALNIIENELARKNFTARLKNILKAVERANEAIYKLAEKECQHMATTITLALFKKNHLLTVHIGDSRLYLFREGKLCQLTQDHSLVTKLIEHGGLAKEQASLHPFRSIITKALGANPTVQPDTLKQEIKVGDRFLLCSDGLTNMVTESEIEKVLAREINLKEACQKLITLANDKGGFDNITVVLFEIEKQDLARRVRLKWLFLLLVALLTAMTLFGIKFWLNNSYFVGLDREEVVIYRGLPGSFAGLRWQSINTRTGIRMQEIKPYYLERLKAGLIVKDEKEALSVINELKTTSK